MLVEMGRGANDPRHPVVFKRSQEVTLACRSFLDNRGSFKDRDDPRLPVFSRHRWRPATLACSWCQYVAAV